MKKCRWISLLLAAVMVMTLCVGAAAEEAQAIDLSGHIVILHTGDVHGRIDENLGYSRVAVARKRLESAGATVLTVDSGDALHGLPFATLSEGEDIVKLMDAAGYDAMGAGSHDFSYGAEKIVQRSGSASFPVLSANALKADGTNLLDGHAIIEKGLVKFGVFALTAQDAVEATRPENTEGLTFGDPIAAARKQVAALEAEECTLIIALTDLGLDENASLTSRMLAGQVEGIDIIVDGGSHTTLENGLWVNSTLIVSAGEYLEAIGCIDIDSNGSAAATLLTGEDFGEADVDAEIDALIEEMKSAQESLLGAVVGETSVELTVEDAQEKETNFGSLAADAIRKATGAEVALINGGSLRAPIQAGEITRGQLIGALPEGCMIVTQTVTGEQLLAALENGVSRAPEADGRFLQASGVSFKFDAKQEAGSRVFDAKVGGEAVDPAKGYTLATIETIAMGADGCPLGDVAIEAEFGTLEEILTAYIESFETAIAPEVEGRIVEEDKPAA